MKRDSSVRVCVRLSGSKYPLVHVLLHSHLRLLLFLLPLTALSASLYTETFSNTTGGWQDRDTGKMFVTNVLSGGNPGGALAGTFPFSSGPPSFDATDAFVATGALSTANFMGNYNEVDAWVLGFDFMAANVLPSAFHVQIYSGALVLTRDLGAAITQTGVWHAIKLSLLDADSGGWGGDAGQFSTIVTNVTRIEFRITRRDNQFDTPAQTYYLDNIFLDRVPDAVLMTPTNQIWLHMRNGASYRYQATTNLAAPDWSTLSSFTATTSVYSVTLPATNDWRFFRMVLE
ncbi:MAG TPA: hypothetical protein PKE26_11550 [Kiritimatiellia bacterium]|nr:hypothetical protein [Kiritimatiellia bacterium]HMO99736.1 hypothetical protein [Kiritimatiellia bacterium]HMP98105.1 hypothetical protein [Kiritimatiellia bacterium]